MRGGRGRAKTLSYKIRPINWATTITGGYE